MSKNVITRRSLIRGAGGVAIALPALEIMGWSRFAHAAPVVKPKLIGMFAGGSLGDAGSLVNPATEGTGYETTALLKSIDTFKVKPHVGIVSGLKIPRGSGTACIQHTGDLYHRKSLLPQLAGETNTIQDGGTQRLKGSTFDQLVAAKLGAKSINLRIQPTPYAGESADADGGKMSGKSGSMLNPLASPRVVFDTFLANFQGAAGTGGPSTGPSAEVLAARAKRKSILDLVDGGVSRLMKRLGAADLKTMQAHLEFIRQIEKDLDTIDTKAMGNACKVPVTPGTDPGTSANETQAGWSNETARGKAMVELIALGLACDLWQVATLHVSYSQVFISAKEACGVNTNLGIHEFLHQTGQSTAADRVKCIAWQIDPFARLVSLLAAQNDVDGSPMINSSALTMCFEGGWEGGLGNGDGSHSSNNMVMLYAGKVGGLKPQHVKASGAHPAQVNCGAMKAVGVSAALGEVSTPIAGMFA
jgi:Protein of unknown function (DUF1552)